MLPLNEALLDLVRNKAISLHVPGHKNMTIGHLKTLQLNMDMTEITGLDDLHAPEAVLLDSQRTVRKHKDYDAFYLVNGTTSGILSVIQAFAHQRGQYVMPRNMHKSVFHALDLTQQSAILLPTTMSQATGHYLGPKSPCYIEHADDKKLALFTYPNYYGETFDIHAWVTYCHKRGIPVCVDEAHGAHFGLAGFPQSSLTAGADYVVQSYHKTLPALTMGSVLFIHKAAPYRDDVIRYLNYFQSSSPSYLIMASLEQAHHFYVHYDTTVFFEKRAQLIASLEEKGFILNDVQDPIKLSVSHPTMRGTTIQRCFEDMAVYVELADMYQVLLVLPLWHEGDMYPFDRLISCIRNMRVETEDVPAHTALLLDGGMYTAAHFSTKQVHVSASEGMVLGHHITPYPPGIPMMYKGERISREMITQIKTWQNQNIDLEGIVDDKIRVKDETI